MLIVLLSVKSRSTMARTRLAMTSTRKQYRGTVLNAVDPFHVLSFCVQCSGEAWEITTIILTTFCKQLVYLHVHVCLQVQLQECGLLHCNSQYTRKAREPAF